MDVDERRVEFRGPLNERYQRVRDGYIPTVAVGALALLSLLGAASLVHVGGFEALMQGRRTLARPAALLLILFTVMLLSGRPLRRSYLGVGPLSGEAAGALAESSITWTTDAGTDHYDWSEVAKVRFLPDAVRLRVKPDATLVVLREFVASEPEWVEGIELIRAHTGARRP